MALYRLIVGKLDIELTSCFIETRLGTSLACNFLPFGADVTSLCPKYINIIRGQVLCLILAFAITPWHILTSAPTFLNFLGYVATLLVVLEDFMLIPSSTCSGYAIFQGNIVAIMLVDCKSCRCSTPNDGAWNWTDFSCILPDFIVRKGNIDIRDLYSESRDAKYWYTYGVNWRATLAFVAGFAVPLPGFIGSFGTTTVSVAASRMYALGWALSLVVGGLVYWVMCLIWPVPGDDKDHGYEELARYYDENPLGEVEEIEGISKMGGGVRPVTSLDDDKMDAKETV